MEKLKTNDELEEKILRRIPIEILALSLILSLSSLAFFDITVAFLIFSGGILASIGFIWLKQSVSHFLSIEKKKVLRSALIFYALRLLLIITVFFIIIFFFSKKIIAFIAGFSTIIVAVLIEGVIAIPKIKKWKN